MGLLGVTAACAACPHPCCCDWAAHHTVIGTFFLTEGGGEESKKQEKGFVRFVTTQLLFLVECFPGFHVNDDWPMRFPPICEYDELLISRYRETDQQR